MVACTCKSVEKKGFLNQLFFRDANGEVGKKEELHYELVI